MEEATLPAGLFHAEPWIEAFGLVARHYRLPGPAQDSKLASLWKTGGDDTERIRVVARGAGLRVRFLTPGETKFSSERLPMIVELADGGLAVVTAIDASGDASVAIMGEGGLENN